MIRALFSIEAIKGVEQQMGTCLVRIFQGMIFMLFLSSCGIVAPAVQPFEDYKDFMLTSTLQFTPEGYRVPIVVPKGFVTDYASIPGMLDPIASRKNRRYQTAAVIHDWLYWNGYDRREADRILYEAARASGVQLVDSGLIWAGVRVGGEGAWRKNQELKQAGYLRVIPEGYRDPHTWPDSWPGYREDLHAAGIRKEGYDPNLYPLPRFP